MSRDDRPAPDGSAPPPDAGGEGRSPARRRAGPGCRPRLPARSALGGRRGVGAVPARRHGRPHGRRRRPRAGGAPQPRSSTTAATSWCTSRRRTANRPPAPGGTPVVYMHDGQNPVRRGDQLRRRVGRRRHDGVAEPDRRRGHRRRDRERGRRAARRVQPVPRRPGAGRRRRPLPRVRDRHGQAPDRRRLPHARRPRAHGDRGVVDGRAHHALRRRPPARTCSGRRPS